MNFANRIPELPPIINPLPSDVIRPLWSVMIPSFNCINFIGTTLQSVLSQDPGVQNMQIEVIDDFSTDGDIETLVKEVGKGRVGFFRQPENKGSLRNFETCLQRSKGHFVHLLHGDDQVKNGFYKEIENLFISFPQAGAAFTGTIFTDEKGAEGHHLAVIKEQQGIIENWLITIAQGQRLQAPAIVVKREVYEHLGGYFAVHYGEDWEMYVRIAANYPVAYSPANLALYRVQTNSISTKSYLSGQNFQDINKVMGIIERYLPEAKRNIILKESRRTFSIFFAKTAHDIFNLYRNRKIALRQAHYALQLDTNKVTIKFLIKLYIKCLIY